MIVPYRDPPLKLGSRGNRVYAVKRALKAAGYARTMLPNTVYGPGTVLNVRKFQKFFGLRVDGQVGPLTLLSLSTFFDDYGYFLYTGRVPSTQGWLTLPLVLQQPTHETSGLPGFPANDLFRRPGTQLIAPADCRLVYPHFIGWSETKRVGGWTCYLQFFNTNQTSFDTHMGMVNVAGEYRKGDAIGTIGRVPEGWWAPHVHHGLHQGIYDPDV